ncbi:unnamed protein product [Lampetra planeri]
MATAVAAERTRPPARPPARCFFGPQIPPLPKAAYRYLSQLWKDYVEPGGPSAGAAREGNCQMDNGAGGAVESYNQNRATPRFVRRVRNPGPLAPRRAPGLGANLAPPCPRPAARFTDF